LGCIYERILHKNSLASFNDIAETFINDGDEVVMEGWCLSRESGNYFGFGQCRGVVLPALDIEA
jgi:fumarylacetoacetase